MSCLPSVSLASLLSKSSTSYTVLLASSSSFLSASESISLSSSSVTILTSPSPRSVFFFRSCAASRISFLVGAAKLASHCALMASSSKSWSLLQSSISFSGSSALISFLCSSKNSSFCLLYISSLARA